MLCHLSYQTLPYLKVLGCFDRQDVADQGDHESQDGSVQDWQKQRQQRDRAVGAVDGYQLGDHHDVEKEGGERASRAEQGVDEDQGVDMHLDVEVPEDVDQG